MTLLQAGAVRLDTTDLGSGPAFVLVHGYRSSHRIWEACQHALADRGFRSIAISMRGAAGSDVTDAEADYAPANFAKDVAAAVDALDLPRFLLVGHSLGARTVTHYARDHADRLAGLVLMSGGALIPRSDDPEALARWQENIDGYPGNINRPYWEAEHVGLSPEVRALLWEDWQRVPPQRLRGAWAVTDDLRPVLAGMAVPTLVLFGDADHTVSPGDSVQGYMQLPGEVRHLHVFHGVDHSPNSVVPEDVAAALAKFAGTVGFARE